MRRSYWVVCCIALLAGSAKVVYDARSWRGEIAPHPEIDAQAWNFLIGPQSAEEEDRRRQGDFIDGRILANGGLFLAVEHTGAAADSESLTDLREAIESRGRRALAARQAHLAQLNTQNASLVSLIRSHYEIGLLWTYEGNLEEATKSLETALALCDSPRVPPRVRTELSALLGIVALRQGEVDNCIGCLGPSSCIFPIARDAVHQLSTGSRQAIRRFSDCLAESPGDLRIRWLLNVAYMTLGEYPDNVPAEHLIPLGAFGTAADTGRFDNIAPRVGLASRGPNLAGGSVFDDFTGDGRPDIFSTSLDVDRGASLFVNRGNGRFEDASSSAGLDQQVYALNVTRADFDNDGYLDVMLLRGGWETPMRLSLLHNRGDGTFEDATLLAGMSEPIATEAAAWADYDHDGLVDVYVCGEYLSPYGPSADTSPDSRNRCRLYRNLGSGIFADTAAELGIENEQCAKGAVWGDYDGDGWLDLYVSNRGGPSRLYRNDRGSFVDLAPLFAVTGPPAGFACLFFDYDNDGFLDLYVNDFTISLAETAASALGVRTDDQKRPRLYRNLNGLGFREVTREIGLGPAFASMGSNPGDIDNDGFLDLYFGTGQMSLEAVVPNLLFKNMEGSRFNNVTIATGTGHLQKGHGVSFADWDSDGDLDFFVEAGGAVPGDQAYNVLFQNPGNENHWLKVKVSGKASDRTSLGASIRAVVKGSDGDETSIFRTVGTNSSFGGNNLVELIGLGDATAVAELNVTWPATGTKQTYRNLAAGQFIEIIEGSDSYRRLFQPSIQPGPRPPAMQVRLDHTGSH